VWSEKHTIERVIRGKVNFPFLPAKMSSVFPTFPNASCDIDALVNLDVENKTDTEKGFLRVFASS
jgi:hypothetical protein